MRPFDYARPTTLDDVVLLLQDGASTVRPLAGGTDLLTLMKANIVAPSQVLDIKHVSQLTDTIVEHDDGVTLGALTTLAQIEHHPRLQQRYSALTEAVAQAATPQLRNRATLGGNLLQRPRCWYFRDEHFDCWLKGGDTCHARDGQNELHAIMDMSPCVAVHPSDLSTALLAFNAEVRIHGTQGERTMSLGEFFVAPTAERRTENILGDDEVIVAVHVSTPAKDARSTYLKAMDRKVWAFALVGVAVQATVDSEQQIVDVRVVLGGVAPVPWRSEAAEQVLLGNQVNDALLRRAAHAAVENTTSLQHNGYKIDLAENMVRRALEGVTMR